MRTENVIQVLKDKNKSQLVGVEIGVWNGQHSLEILQNLNIQMLYLVDPYIVHYLHNRKGMGPNETKARKLLAPYDDKITWINSKADDAKNYIPNNLDFVYINGSHSTNFVIQDVEEYYPKVKSRGFISVHSTWKAEMGEVIDMIADFHSPKMSLAERPKEQSWIKGDAEMTDWWWTKK